MNYVKFKVKAGSGGVVLGPKKYFPPVFCRTDYSTHLEVLDLLEFQNGGLESRHTSSQIGRIRSPSASELCQIQGYGWIWRSRFTAYEIFSTGILSTHFGGPRYA